MKSMMARTTLREIKQSLGRFLAIFAIVCLGVGLFAGLKITRQVMVQSADNYLKEEQLYDYRLLSTLGFEEEDVEFFAGKEDVRAAEGAYFSDIIYIDTVGNEHVIKAHSLLSDINGMVVKAGRMPEAADECVVDSNLFGEDAIGDKIILSESNKKDDLDGFAYKEYTITGIVHASYYSQYERGTTSLGNGSVSGFMYLLPEGFSMDYYTEIYVKFAEDYEIYSDEYKNFIEKKDAVWEDYCKEAGDRRYREIVTEAENELKEKEDEFYTEKADGEEKLADALKELEDGQKELADGEKALKDARSEWQTSMDELTDNENTLAAMKEQALAMGNEAYLMQLAGQEQALSAAKEQLVQADTALKEKEQTLGESKKDLEEGLKEYETSRQEFDDKIKEAEEKMADARKEIEDIPEATTYVLGRDTNTGYVCFENDSSIVDGIANVFPVFFFLIAALVCMTTMNRMVEEQRTQIGVLKALGYSDGKIMGKYLFYSGSAAISGCLIGYFGGTYLFPKVIYWAYGIMYHFGPMQYCFDKNLLLISVLASMFCSMGVTFLSCRSELREVAAGLMRPKAPKAGKRVFLEYIPFIWKRLKFLQKVSVRNILRYKKRFFMMIVGISGCTALLITGFGIRDSVVKVADMQYEEIQVFDLKATFKEDTGKEAPNAEFDEVLKDYDGKCTYVLETSMDLIGDKKTKSVNLVVPKYPEEIGDYIRLHTSKKEEIAYPGKGEAVLTEKMAKTFRLSVGDSITLRNDDGKTLTATISGICENYIYNYVYLSPETYEASMGKTEYKTAYIILPEDTDMHEAGAAFMQADGISAVNVNRDMLSRISGMMKSMNYIIFVIIACAATLAFIVLYNLNNINITERIREIATIKVLGFYRNETAAYVFRENTALTLFGCLFGIFLGKWLHAFVMSRIDIDLMSFDTRITPLSYVYSICLTFLFTFLVNRFMNRKLDKINMAESLKSVD